MPFLPENRDTFVRQAAVMLRWALGERAHRLTSTLAGLLPDMIADAVRQAMRFTMPLLTDAPVDALPYLLRSFGLPTYEEIDSDTQYFATLDRLRAAWTTHETAGAATRIEEEAVTAGLTDAEVFTDQTLLPFPWRDGLLDTDHESAFGIFSTDATAPPDIGEPGLVFGADAIVGAQGIGARRWRNIRALMAYFRPARERFIGIFPPS